MSTFVNKKQKQHNDPQFAERKLPRRKLWIILPAWNEEAGLPPLLQKIGEQFELSPQNYEVIVVDDASADRTGEIASRASFQMPLRLCTHETNQGLAGALRTGFNEALAAGSAGDVIVTLDADNTQQPGTIHRLLQMIDDGCDVAIASRYQPGSRVLGVPANRRFMTWAARWIFRWILPIPGVRDYTCGFRAYRFETLQAATRVYGDSFVSEKGFSCMVDVLLKLRYFGIVFGEVPMLLRYDQKHGASKMNVGRTATQTVQLLLRRRFERPPQELRQGDA
jgi:dolichol-phosphate mannosyltransferase